MHYGYIGLGNLGGHLAHSLVKKGYKVTVFDLDRSLADLRAADVATFTAPSQGGGRRAYSLVRLVDGELFALGSWPVDAPGIVTIRALPAMAFPLLMWLVSLVAAWAAAETLVTRHMEREWSRGRASKAPGKEHARS